MSSSNWWDNEDEFIQHDRQQLWNQAWPTAVEGLGKPIITSTPLGGNEFYKMWNTKIKENEITTDNSVCINTQEH